jgi:phosphoglycerate kinase
MRHINEIDIYGKALLIRADFNVPLDSNLNITDDTRIRSVLPTINYALDEQAKVILCSHMGRPKGQRVESFSLAPVAKRLSRLLRKDVLLAPDSTGKEVERMVQNLDQGEVILLENLRFNPGETKNDEEMGRQLAALADVYINDAFAVAHRAHASVAAVARYVPEKAAGFLMTNEFSYFHKALEEPARPLVAIIGGAKITSKLGALENLLQRVDKMIIGGAMANTFLKSVGHEIGRSLHEPAMVPVAGCLLELAREMGVKMFIPCDCVVADKPESQAATKVVTGTEVPPDWYIMDIGPATSLLYAEALANAKTIVWNGPMGAFEMDAFSRGTYAMVQHVAQSYALTIIGGGDTDVAVHKAGESAKVSYISTGGGAFIALLEGRDLPAVCALEDRFEDIDKKGPPRRCQPEK